MQAFSHGSATAATSETHPITPSPDTADSPETPRVIAIVGGGFSGVTVAIQLLRRPWRVPPRIILVEPRDELGAGVAYATRDYPYPLNVTAGQMSLDGARPHDFLEYARAQGIHAAPSDYLPRQVYGEYLRARFSAACAAAAPRAHCVHHRASALQLRRTPDGRFDLWLDDGTALRPDAVVLAVGNAPPATPPQLEGIAHTEHYVRDPWSIGALTGPEVRSVLLVGSGLTMIDAALRLAAIRPRLRHIHVLSRHGLLPLPQASAPQPAVLPALAPDAAADLAATGSLRALVKALRSLGRTVSEAGGDWREVLAVARPKLPALWQRFGAAERARFLRHARALWEAHRHRAPTGPLAAVQSLARRGVLDVQAGRLAEATAVDGAAEVIWRPRGAAKTRAWLVDRIVNCTGPDSCVGRHGDPFVQSLLANGLIRADVLGLGIDVNGEGRVIARDGKAVESLFYLGPWLRARDWEATAVPELREQAAALAARLFDEAVRTPKRQSTTSL